MNQPLHIAIIDYGSGNLHSTFKAFETVAQQLEPSATVTLVTRAKDLADATHIVLPGVGAFGDCMAGLAAIPNMISALTEHVQTLKKPFFGICVGMQLLASRGFEHGEHQGLGWISGDVIAITPTDPSLKIPHMGWNDLTITNDHPIFKNIKTGDHAYFIHSYHMACTNPQNTIATTDYTPQITAMVAQNNIIGTQFHPEKSQQLGLQLIKNFLLM